MTAARRAVPGSTTSTYAVVRRWATLAITAEDAGRLCIPLWDAGFVLGHSVRTVKEALDLADADLDAMTALLDVRCIVGDVALVKRSRPGSDGSVPSAGPARQPAGQGVACRRQAAGAHRPEMQAPNLKDGPEGWRDLQAPGRVGWALEPGPGTEPGWAGGARDLVALGYLQAGRSRALGDGVHTAARRARRFGAPGDHRALRSLALQDQDAVARLVGAVDADALVRGVG